MKKLLFAFASLALISNAAAQDGADIKWNAEMRFRFTNVENTTTGEAANDNRTVQRTKIGATFTKGEDLTATVTLLNAATWGSSDSGVLVAGETDNDVIVYEAFAFWKAMDNFAVKVGRGALDLADGTVVARNDWEQRPYAFEGAMGVYFTEWANVNVFGIKGMEEDVDTVDVNFYGASLDFKNLPEVLKMLNFHALSSHATAIPAGAEKQTKLRLGVTAKGDVNAIDYRLTYATYSGEDTTAGTAADTKGTMIDAEVGFSMPAMMNSRFAALYHTDSGTSGTEDETYDPFFYEKHANAGLMDIVGWGNLTYIKVGASFEPMEMTKVGVDYYMFTKTEEVDDTFNQDGTAVIAAGGNDDIGNEIDVWATKALSNGAELNARIGMFQTGDAFGATKEDVTQASLGATFKF